ncbi:unnamed protein product [Protopolystoma xenopodis]|uniref:Uncharacterized protein n=1 Tax=Protopolystoma xenopodis TaxID=117903 RepID=A0A448X2F2_9PLAT|nr:unnamed protein product [Protopolystoma xenopodis]
MSARQILSMTREAAGFRSTFQTWFDIESPTISEPVASLSIDNSSKPIGSPNDLCQQQNRVSETGSKFEDLADDESPDSISREDKDDAYLSAEEDSVS